MKICIFTDNHFCPYSSIVRGRDKEFSFRIQNQIDSLNWVNELAEAKGCSYLMCLGDFFDKPELDAESLTALSRIKWSKIPKYFLVGNHEMALNDLSYNSTNALASIPNSVIVDKPQNMCGFGFDIYMIPYIPESNRKPLKSYIDELNAGVFKTQEFKYTIILSHNDISGIRYGQWESKIGFDINEIEQSCFLYINGHLHNQTQLSKKILNLGNLTGQNFSEDAFKYSHCAAILDTDTLNIELINNPYALNFYKVDVLSKYDFNKLLKIENNAVLSIKTYQSLIDDLRQHLANFKNIVTYRITTIPEEIKSNDNSITKLLKLDHISQFKSFVKEMMDNNSILEEELLLIK